MSKLVTSSWAVCQLYHDENNLHFDDTIIIAALYKAIHWAGSFQCYSLKQQSEVDMLLHSAV